MTNVQCLMLNGEATANDERRKTAFGAGHSVSSKVGRALRAHGGAPPCQGDALGSPRSRDRKEAGAWNVQSSMASGE